MIVKVSVAVQKSLTNVMSVTVLVLLLVNVIVLVLNSIALMNAVEMLA